ncbi:hypothetical protein BOTBODRAFT_133259 [Botryobasidium botryosum FD-172 SS1]|uniref:Kinesin motor domain-containing protein n=1 Tax=Botryobasidium botryosum (strain FD-172 SS1) TaxID=930990 RepID=A0A067MG64_BOTB1|nr:hypothetical protein BOTBODRAFT_133259 [Botryobasidium botryosum FD-172 SS1]
MASRLPRPPATRSSTRAKPSATPSEPPAPATRTRATRAATAAASAAQPTASSTRRSNLSATTKTTAAATKQTRATKASEPPATKARNRAVTNKPVATKEDAHLPTPPPSSVVAPEPTLPRKVSVVNLKSLPSDDREPIKAFLRIRPPPSAEEQSTDSPYLTFVSPTDVQMSAPALPPSSFSRLRAPTPSRSTYKFTQVFPHTTLQAEFFKETALPMVQNLLSGENGLLFAYGVTNSGKTYTIQGGKGPGESGLLPRTLDVIFNSVEGLHSEAPFRPVHLAGIEREMPQDLDEYKARTSVIPIELSQKPVEIPFNADEDVLEGLLPESERTEHLGFDDTSLPVDRNYEYSIWVSYAEIYNEKIFDLLGVSQGLSSGIATERSSIAPPASPRLPRSSTFGSLASSSSDPSLAAQPLLLKRLALPLKTDPATGGKYIANLREIRVRSAAEARQILKLGQINRRVFGTVANRESSRSHAVFTCKVIRVHKGSPNDPDSVQTARLSIVDLAGSERTKNTQNTGERLKEAGNINNSLMVLGQCMEVLRANQRKLAIIPHALSPLAPPKLAVVPFRHSKLTELFQDFFIGEGRAVMIVNVNPYDTGFEENSHVMRFSALAREVATVTHKPQLPSLKKPEPVTRKVTLSFAGTGDRKPRQTLVEIVEESEESAAGDAEEDVERDTLVDRLFEELEDLRIRLYEAELRSAIIESQVREEVTREMEERMRLMERMHAQRLMDEVEENEVKMDKKIDMLHRAGMIGVGASNMNEGDSSLEIEGVDHSILVESESSRAPSPSPPARQKEKPRSTTDSKPSADATKVEEEELTEDERTEEEQTVDGFIDDEAEEGSEVEDEDDTQEEEEEEEEEEASQSDEEWVPEADEADDADEISDDTLDKSTRRSAKEGPAPTDLGKEKEPVLPLNISPKKVAPAPPTPPINREGDKVEETTIIQTQDTHAAPSSTSPSLDGDESEGEAMIVPDKKARQKILEEQHEDDSSASSRKSENKPAKKKKRQLGNKAAVMTEDDILEVTRNVELSEMATSKSGNIRRMRVS